METLGHAAGSIRKRVTRQSSEERGRILDALAVKQRTNWIVRFSFMLAMSVVIAVMGLLSNSAAVVIGAMLVAPLMTPVLGCAACLSMGWVRLGLRSAAIVAFASAGSILLSFLLSRLIPDGGLTGEALSRTGPALTDLLVALAAGMAGAYATVRVDVSSSLPGVAVAVALVPPLATVGIMLENDRTDLAQGALLLYIVNLIAIVFAGMAVFVATGFVPARRLSQFRGRLGVITIVVATLLVALAMPLASATEQAISRAQQAQRVQEATGSWLAGRGLDVTSIEIDDAQVRIDVAGPVEPPPTDALRALLDEALGRSTVVEVRWTLRSAIRESLPEPTPTEPTSEVVTAATVNGAIVDWLDVHGVTDTFEVTDTTIDGDRVTIDLVGPVSPPSSSDLVTTLSAVMGAKVDLRVRWSQRVVVGDQGTDSDDESARVRQVAIGWAGDLADFAVIDVRTTSERVSVTVSGPTAPASVADLVGKVQTELARDVEVDVYFVQSRSMSTATIAPTTTPPTTTSPVTTSLGATGTTGPN